MSNIFFISDTHFGHEKTCTVFKMPDGSPLRPFANAEAMNEQLVTRWNSVVAHNDKVYHLGDVVINKKFLPIMERLNGSKRLIRGNHDVMKLPEYRKYFTEIYGVRVLDGMILSHIPLHRESVVPRMGVNVHGHLHGEDIPDGAYFNVSVEQINFTPIELSELRIKIKQKQDKYPQYEYSSRTSGNGPT